MAVSLWLLFDQQLYLQSVGAQQTDYYVGTYIILGVGGIMTLVGKLLYVQGPSAELCHLTGIATLQQKFSTVVSAVRKDEVRARRWPR